MRRREAFGGLVDWEIQTNADGGFVWYDAPHQGKFYLDVFRAGFSPGSAAVVLPEEGEITIELTRE